MVLSSRTDPRRNASPECWQLHGEVQGYGLRHPWLVRDLHQLGVDAYAAQHAPRDPRGGPPLPAPASTGAKTVFDVAAAGAMADSPAGHDQALRAWAAAVWRAWSAEHAAVAALAGRLLG